MKGISRPDSVAPPNPKSRELGIERRPGQSMDGAVTELSAAGLASNAVLVVDYSSSTFGELSLTDMVERLRESGKAVNANDFAGAEQMLNAQAVALNSIFGELARRAAENMGQHVEVTERYLRLALKAQAQCRAALETLATIKNPPVVFAKQANFASGPQQVNNGVSCPATPTRAQGNGQTRPTELLEDSEHGSTYLDTRPAGTPAASDPSLEALGAVHGATKCGR